MDNEPQKFSPIGYAMSAVKRLPEKWNDPKINRNAMRAAFRRWRPDSTGDPTMEMRSYVWGIIGPPTIQQNENESDEERRRRNWLTNMAVDWAAILVALRAVAGESEGAPISLGTALFQADISDRRFARLVTQTKAGRLEALRRIFQTTAHAGIPINWNQETRNIYSFLFGKEEQKKQSIDLWAADFFRSRGKTEKDGEEEKAEPVEENAAAE